MTNDRRRLLLFSVLLITLTTTAFWAGTRLLSVRHHYQATLDRTARVEAMAQLIEGMRLGVVAPSDEPLSPQAIAGLLPEALRAAGLSERALADVRYLPPRRPAGVGRDSPFRLERVELRVEAASMHELAVFTHHLLTRRPGLFVYEVRLTGKTDAHQGDPWTADPLTIAFLTDQPQSQHGPTARRR